MLMRCRSRLMFVLALLIHVLLLLVSTVTGGADFYGMLGVGRDADDRTIRRAFKKLAITKHPDKDSSNPNAHEDFIKLNRAYEVLKDPDLRRKYDQFGEEGLSDDNKNAGHNYQSWNFYSEKFGIYDDDEEIVTLSRAEFARQVSNSNTFWFINFYSTWCGHCHQLAPAWRDFARRMNGIIRVGAVNCAEDPYLCQSQNVHAYPSLVVYPQQIFYSGSRDVDALVEFVTSRLHAEIIHVTHRNVESLTRLWEPYAVRPWLIDFCDEMEECFSLTKRRMLAHMLQGVVNVATVDCRSENREKLCSELRDSGLAFYPAGLVLAERETTSEAVEVQMSIKTSRLQVIPTLDVLEAHAAVLRQLPPIPSLDEASYRRLVENHDDEARDREMLVFFASSSAAIDDAQNGDLKKLSAALGDVDFRVVDCSTLDDRCTSTQIGALPRLVFFRRNGNFIVHYGKKFTLHEAKSFVTTAQRSQLINLNEAQYRVLRERQTAAASSSSDIWLIDFFAPWCNPCLMLMAELNKLEHTLDGRRLRTAIVDCDTHKALCESEGVSSYPTSLLLFGAQSTQLVGFHNAEGVADFIVEALSPSVVELGPAEFDEFVVNKPAAEIFVVDFFAPWCQPCMTLAPEYRKLARIMQAEGADSELVSFGSVDCEQHAHLCRANGIASYPTVRVYAQKGRQFDYPPNFWRNHESMKSWIKQFFPTNVESIDGARLTELMERETKIALVVDYYASWCSHCVQFAPIYDEASRLLNPSTVLFAKVDCQEHHAACARAAVSAYPTIKLYAPGRRKADGGVRLNAQPAVRFVNVIQRILGDQGYSTASKTQRDEL